MKKLIQMKKSQDWQKRNIDEVHEKSDATFLDFQSETKQFLKDDVCLFHFDSIFANEK
jgi:hypothetical protein